MNRTIGVVMCVLVLGITACNDAKKEEDNSVMETEKMEMADKQQQATEMEKMEEEKKAMAIETSITGKAISNKDLSTLVTALKAADLATMLSEPGNYTVFAPSNQAFSKLPEGTVDALLKPENKENLQSILKYHVVSGQITSDKLMEAIKGGNGKYTFKTVTGKELTAMMDGDQYVIHDSRGEKSEVVLGSVEASNGIVYIINDVLMTK
ncbi:fasciclin domain-containing protein [Winogradskyella psychrotolerans]|uniref:fasciclin domain-containing protein n=1 Tax=Winogradskyella psychrotolerans TaxID=1344585 RepID=UPI001C073F0D|nr:fasciclin domain-containing protein [Winogradskyella psychrotolerans]MBU2927669.1 fasciclin domain-containing protein [Winogradskyella psychrotolerans]